MLNLEIWFSQSSRVDDFCLLWAKPYVCDFPKLFLQSMYFFYVAPEISALLSLKSSSDLRTISLNVCLKKEKKVCFYKSSDRWHQGKPLRLRAQTNASICASSSHITRPVQMHRSKYFEDKIISVHTSSIQLLWEHRLLSPWPKWCQK